MHFTKLVSSAALIASAFSYKILLYTNDVNEVLFKRAGLSVAREGADANYITVGTFSNVLEFDKTTGEIYKEVKNRFGEDERRLYLDFIANSETNQGFPFLQLTSASPSHKWSINDRGVLQVAGGDKKYEFYAAQKTKDSENYQFFVGVGYNKNIGENVFNLNKIYITVDDVATPLLEKLPLE